MKSRKLMGSFALAVAAFAFVAGPALAEHQECGCSETICSAQGFEITNTGFTVDQLGGVSKWRYKICNDEGQDQNCVPPKDLSHVDIVLPGLGECVTNTQLITIAQLGCPGCDPVLNCSMSDKDPSCPDELCAAGTGGKFCQGGPNDGDSCTNNQSCGCAAGGSCATPCTSVPCQPVSSPNPLKVLKCDVAGGSNLDPGECVEIEITIAGEQPTLGQGAVDSVTKAGPECERDAICGPACDCEERRDGCLTRSPGFWGNHPHIAANFLPVTVCGKTLSTVNAGVCGSVSEALCSTPGLEGNRRCDKRPAYVALVRQLAAAKLNIAATAANGGTCDAGITQIINDCERLYCNGTQSSISGSGCIEALDDFNNSLDTLPTTPAPFDNPGPANPSYCKAAHDNGLVIGKKCTVDCRY